MSEIEAAALLLSAPEWTADDVEFAKKVMSTSADGTNATQPSEDVRALVEEARKQTVQLANEGVSGTPNLLSWMADALLASVAEVQRLKADVRSAHQAKRHAEAQELECAAEYDEMKERLALAERTIAELRCDLEEAEEHLGPRARP